MPKQTKRVLVTGGAGYVGTALIPLLLQREYAVTVLDVYMFGDDIFQQYRGHENLKEIKGDIRKKETVEKALEGCDTVIHLACISNDPSFELNPELGKSINYDCFRPLVQSAKKLGIKRFIYASSSSVYGIKDEQNVTEELSLEPLTDYSKYKALCEDILLEEATDDFIVVTLRPATVCGYAPRQRLDVVVNILVNQAYNLGHLTILGGSQLRPNIHIEDMINAYLMLLEAPGEKIHKKIYNVGHDNYSVEEIAAIVKNNIKKEINIVKSPTNDLRSYHISSEKIKNELGFYPKKTIADAVQDLVKAFEEGKLEDSLNNPRYYNIKMMNYIDFK